MFLLKNVRRIFFLVFFTGLLALPVFSETIIVYDGSTTGTDTDWWSSATTYSANWTDDIVWGTYGTPHWYHYILKESVSGNTISSGDIPVGHTNGTPPRFVDITGINLTDNKNYIIHISAWYTPASGGGDVKITEAYSDGVTTDFSPPVVTITSQYSYTANNYTVSWSGTDDNSGIANYDVQYSSDGSIWQNWHASVTNTSDIFADNNKVVYQFRVRAQDNAGNYSDWVYTPTAKIISLNSVQTSSTFNVSWAPIGLAQLYDVQFKAGNGTWQNWKTLTASTSDTFTGNNGQSYSLRVRAHDTAGNIGAWSPESSSAQTVVNSISTSMSLSISPSSISFPSTVGTANLTLSILATGGNITVNSITESRNYPSWGSEEEPPQSVSIPVTGGATHNENISAGLDSIQRTKALGSGTEGSFTLTYTVSAADSNGNPISASVSIPAAVSGGLPSSLSVSGVSLQLPPSPYYVGDTVQNAEITIDASGSGNVSGQVLVDGDTSWSTDPTFNVTVNGTTHFNIQGQLPTDTTGDHTVRVEIMNPVELSTEETYTVSNTTPTFPPETLTLVKDVAELTDLNGTADAMNGDHYQEFTFTGTAKMKLFSIKDDNGNPTVLSDVTVNNLVIRYDDVNPTTAKIQGGTVEKEVTGNEVIATIAKGYLRVKKVSFTGQASPAADSITVDTKLYIPKLHMELFEVGGLIVKTEGVEGKAVSINENAPLTFDAFGATFGIHDVGSEKALVIGKDNANDRFYFTLSGGISMSEKNGIMITKKEMTTFSGLTFYTDGNVDGTITFNNSFDVIPGTLTFNHIEIKSENDNLTMKLGGELKKLPYPLDFLGNTAFEFSFDQDGNTEGLVVPIHELAANSEGHGLGGSDSTEWGLGIGNLDVTYLALHLIFNEGIFYEDQSELQIGADIYLNLKNQDGSPPRDDEKRISFGELNANDDFTGGIRIAMNGDVTWNAPTNATNLSNKRLDLGSLTISIDSLGVASNPFKIVCTGGIILGLHGVTSDINFDNLEIGLDGTVSNFAISDGKLDAADIVHIDVDDVEWSNSPTSLTFQADTTTGEGENRAFKKADKTVQVTSYMRLKGASINIGSTHAPVMSGSFDELTVYKPESGSRSFVLKNVDVVTSDVELKNTDIEYTSSVLHVSGEVKLPNNITAVAVGKMGSQNGTPTMGIFIAVSGLSITVGPGVFLDEIGGGIFINPVQDDIDLVRTIARFKRPELSEDITNKRPGGEGNPGSFAVMLLGGVYVSDKDIFHGRALITITANYFNLDAEAECLDGTLKGTAYLAIGWNPSYGEGNVEVDMDFLSILGGHGSLEFYVYSEDTWAVSGAFNISLLGHNVSAGSLFVGPPGFMMEANVSIGLDLKFISGSLTYGGMFWYYKVPDPDTWGAYVHVDARGDFLGGLFSAEAGLEGALIGSPTFVIYAVGSLKVRVCYVTVFNGSLWVSVGENGFHGGSGRNARYDGLIEDARNMADAMNEAKDELTQALEDTNLELAKLNAAQQEAAGLGLVERSGIIGGLVNVVFQLNEYNHWNHWQPGGLPPNLQVIYARIFGPAQQSLVDTRTALQQLQNKISQDINNLNQLQQEIGGKISQYEDILVEELPTVQDIGNLNNPFQGMDEKTVNIGGTSKTVKTGFRINESEADSQRNSLTTVREDFAKYQDAFIEEAGLIDAKLQQLDEILFMSKNNLIELSREYSNVYSEMGSYIERFVQFQGQESKYADESLNIINQVDSKSIVQNTMTAKAGTLNTNTLNSWNIDRIQLIQSLLHVGSIQGEVDNTYNPPEGISPPQLFITTGVELWWNIPVAGFNASKTHSIQRRAQAIAAFQTSASSFRSKWSSATNVIDRIFEKKSDMYNVLFEIYDQLALYGTGEIGIAADGNAAGIAGLSGAGLAFRTKAVADSAKKDAVQLPPGATPPKGPVIGPLRPAAPSAPKNSGGIQFKGKTSVPGTGPRTMEEKQGNSSVMTSSSIMPGSLSGTDDPLLAYSGGGFAQEGNSLFQPTVGSSAGSGSMAGNIGTIKLGSNSGSFPEYAGITRNMDKYRAALTPVEWVSVNRYFEGKRAEIEPYLAIPSVENFFGTLSSRNEFSALLTAQYSGAHPVGVVEYEYKIEPAGTGQTGGTGSSPSAGFQLPPGSAGQINYEGAGGSYVVGGSPENNSGNSGSNNGQGGSIDLILKQLMAFPIMRPWFSLGDNTALSEPFFPDINSPGEYYLYLKIRGAGGKSIIRRATVNLRYFNPDTDHGPVTSNLDTSDSTPPAKPVVNLEGPYTFRINKLYAKWNSSDPESGIQGYEYAVGTYKPSLNTVQNTVLQGSGSIGVSTTEALAGIVQNAVPGGSAGTGNTAGNVQVPEDILTWTGAGGRKEVNIRNLNLEPGKKYVVSVRVTNGVGLKSIGTSDPILVDTTAPVDTAITSLEQVSADGYPNSVHFTFNAGEDPESGIVSRLFAVGTSEDNDKLVEWREVANNTATVVDLPISDGDTVYIKVKSVNGAGLETVAHDSLTMHYTDSTSPPEVLPITFPSNFTADKSKLAFGWDKIMDGESGITGYEYGIGTSETYPDIVSWTPVSLESKPYVLKQGTTRDTQENTYEIEKEGLSLIDGQTYYVLVRATNGAGFTSIGTSSPVTVDTSPPDEVSVSASEYSTSLDKLSVQVRARDVQSGIKAYRFAVWTVPETSQEDGEFLVIPVSGTIAGGTFQGAAQIQGSVLPNAAAGVFTGGGGAQGGSESAIQGAGTQLPPWTADIDMWGTPWFESEWTQVSSGVPPESIDLTADIEGFPTGIKKLFNPGHSLQYGKSYRVKIWVQNGAGVEKAAGAVIINVVSRIPESSNGKKPSSSRKGNVPQIINTGI